MAYDNTKLDLAVKKWLKKECKKSKNDTVYARDLFQSFLAFIEKTKALKNSPGRVAFGMALGRKGYKKKKVTGYSAWAGLKLINPPAVSAIAANSMEGKPLARLSKRVAAREAEEKSRQEKEKRIAERDRLDHIKHTQARMKSETKKKNQAAGLPEVRPAPPVVG